LTKKEFMDTFSPMGMIQFKSYNGLRAVIAGYYEEVKQYPISILHRVMLDIERDYDNYHFPSPSTLAEKCRIKSANFQNRGQGDVGLISQEEADTPRNRKARLEFFKKVAAQHDKHLINGGDETTHIAVCMGLAIISDPYEQAKADEKKRLENWGK